MKDKTPEAAGQCFRIPDDSVASRSSTAHGQTTPKEHRGAQNGTTCRVRPRQWRSLLDRWELGPSASPMAAAEKEQWQLFLFLPVAIRHTHAPSLVRFAQY